MKKRIMVIDTEGKLNKKPYNIGYIIGDKYGNNIKHSNILIPSVIIDNIKSKNNTFSNTKKIEQLFNQSEIAYLSESRAKEKILNDIKDYEVKELWSYGTYDKTTLNNLYDKKFEIDIPFYDITSTLQNRIVNKRYVKFCKDNGYMNVKQDIPLYTLETVYKYIFDREFKQEHTGLADCLAEYEILCNVFKQKQKAILSGGTQLWKRFLEFTKSSQKND